jgi:protein required for attachment to host cells
MRAARTPPRRSPPLRIWVVAADSAQARFFSAERANGGLSEFASLSNPVGRLRTGDLVSDRPGRVANAARGSRTALEPHETAHEHAMGAFAKRLCRRLIRARQTRKVDRLYLVADPAFLGLLRRNLDAPTRRIVAGERNKDLSQHPAAEVRRVLPARL